MNALDFEKINKAITTVSEKERKLKDQLEILSKEYDQQTSKFLSQSKHTESALIGKLLVCKPLYFTSPNRLFPCNEKLSLMADWIEQNFPELNVTIQLLLQFFDKELQNNFEKELDDISIQFANVDLHTVHELKDGQPINEHVRRVETDLRNCIRETREKQYVGIFYTTKHKIMPTYIVVLTNNDKIF